MFLSLLKKPFKTCVSKFKYSDQARDVEFFKHTFVNEMKFRNKYEKLTCFRVIDEDGNVLNKDLDGSIEKDEFIKLFKAMITMHEYDTIFNVAQRQNRINFYISGLGEEASVFGSAAALNPIDVIYPQYREAGALMWRGFPLTQMLCQMTANYGDTGKGRQMPIHYGSKELNYQTISSPLCTQVPQASGAGYHYRVSGQDRIAITYFGDGAASEGDFHTALNFAATLRSQTLFFCRNNMFAISTPINEQYHGDGIAARGVAYGMDTLRVDGNDILAVYNATKEARRIIIQEKRPVLIEAISYRFGDHSTSDFSKMYRSDAEMEKWIELIAKLGDPINRAQRYIEKKGWMPDIEQKRKEWAEESKKDAIDALKAAEVQKKVSITHLFEDVYDKITPNLTEQKKKLNEHLEKYGEHYNLDKYAP